MVQQKLFLGLVLLVILGIIAIQLPNEQHHIQNDVRNVSNRRSYNHRYLQWDNNTTTNNQSDENDTDTDTDDVSADTILITLSIINTIFFVIPTTIRYSIQKRRCLRNSNNMNYKGCICTVQQLQYAIQQNLNSNNNNNNNNNNSTLRVFILCPAITLVFQQSIDITHQSFRLTCGTSRFINTQPCIITSNSNNSYQTNFFIGAPTNVILQNIILSNGYSKRNTNVGGSAIELYGGKMTLQNVILENNNNNNENNDNTISALYVSNHSIVELMGTTIFRNNQNGNDIFISTANQNTMNSKSKVTCIATTLLNRPTFCNGITGIQVENSMNNVSIITQYTNCYNSKYDFNSMYC